MATQTVEFPCVTGQAVTAKLFSFGSDTQVASVSATEATNRKGLYSAAFTDVTAGTYRLIALNGSSVPLAAWDVTLTLTTATFQVFEVGMTASSVSSVSGSVASIASGGITSSSFATDSITATALASSAVSEIQSGLATAANQVIVIDGIGYLLAQETGSATSPQTSAPVYATAFNGNTYTVTHTDVTSAGVRGTATRSKT